MPFDVTFITSQNHPGDLDSYVAGFVSGPNEAAIGLDTVHRKVRIKVGRGLIAGPGVLDSAAKRGTGAMKQGRWGDGLATILQAVGAAVTPAPIAVAAERVVTVAQTEAPSGLPWWIVIIGTLGVGGLVWYFIRRIKDDKEEKGRNLRSAEREVLRESGESVRRIYDTPIPSPNFTRRGATPPVYVPSVTSPPPPVVVVPSSGPNIVDYAIMDSIVHSHDHSAPAPVSSPAPSYSPPPPPRYESPTPPPSYDSGGSDWSSSSSDSGSSSFSGGDSGGSDF